MNPSAAAGGEKEETKPADSKSYDNTYEPYNCDQLFDHNDTDEEGKGNIVNKKIEGEAEAVEEE